MSNRPTRGQPTSRQGRRQAAIQRQLEQEQRDRRARRLRRLGVALGLVVVLVVIAVAEVYLHRLNGEERALLDQASRSVSAAGCTAVQTTRPYPNDRDRTHIGAPEVRTMPPLSTYPSVPPASGPHAPVPLGAGEYAKAPPVDQAIHSLEHSAVIVWYDPSVASSAEVLQMKQFFVQGREQNHVIVAPFDYPSQGDAGRLPSGRSMALVAWHHVQLCNQASLPVAYAFVHAYRFDLYQYGAYKGDAPEKYSPI